MSTDPLVPLSNPNPDGYRDVVPEVARPHLAGLRVVDVREPDEYTGPLGHLREAELVPLQTVAVAAAGWDRERPLLVVCRSGGRSGRAAATLTRMGFRAVYNLAGGMLGWNDRDYPVVERGV